MFKNLTPGFSAAVPAIAGGSSTMLPQTGRNTETHVAPLPAKAAPQKGGNPIDG